MSRCPLGWTAARPPGGNKFKSGGKKKHVQNYGYPDERREQVVDIPVTIVLPSGGSRNAEVPKDVPVKELIPELATALQLPTTGPDGRPMRYRLESKALGRELRDDDTLASAGVPSGDRLTVTADVTAG